mmetsp:Transcript_20604/g.51235  ORF Transcript_20604/g.51235 Transcript_20604/m.51235 type:complete len:244 (+) Transcript_20604:164-895(+)
MKFTIAAPYLFVVAVSFAGLSTEAKSLRGGESLSMGDLSKDILQLDHLSTVLHRRVEEDAEQDEEEDGDQEEEEEEGEDEDQGEEESGEQENEGAAEDDEDAAQEESDDASDVYVFYDDVAIQNCDDGDEDCALAATYAAYDDYTLSNCEDDDEECNDAAAYTAAKKSQEDAAVDEETDPWDLQAYTKKYKSMSKSSQIWTIILAVWSSVMVIFTLYLCCCRKGFQPNKSLKESLIEPPVYDM